MLTMAKTDDKVTKVHVKDEFRVCPECGYKDGFHVSFVRVPESAVLHLVFICPGCSARYDVGKSI